MLTIHSPASRLEARDLWAMCCPNVSTKVYLYFSFRCLFSLQMHRGCSLHKYLRIFFLCILIVFFDPIFKKFRLPSNCRLSYEFALLSCVLLPSPASLSTNLPLRYIYSLDALQSASNRLFLTSYSLCPFPMTKSASLSIFFSDDPLGVGELDFHVKELQLGLMWWRGEPAQLHSCNDPLLLPFSSFWPSSAFFILFTLPHSYAPNATVSEKFLTDLFTWSVQPSLDRKYRQTQLSSIAGRQYCINTSDVAVWWTLSGFWGPVSSAQEERKRASCSNCFFCLEWYFPCVFLVSTVWATATAKFYMGRRNFSILCCSVLKSLNVTKIESHVTKISHSVFSKWIEQIEVFWVRGCVFRYLYTVPPSGTF